MRTPRLLLLLCACGGSQGEPVEPTAEPSTATTSAPTATATAPIAAEPTAQPTSPEPAASDDPVQSWQVQSGSAKGVTLDNEAGGSLKLATLAWTSFQRATGPSKSKTLPNANVAFASVTADGVSASNVICALPPWPEVPKDPATLATAIVPLVAKDAVPAAAVAKIRPALLACTGGKELRVEWEFKESRLVSGKAEGADAKTSTCVKTALAKAFMMDSGLCAATLAP